MEGSFLPQCLVLNSRLPGSKRAFSLIQSIQPSFWLGGDFDLASHWKSSKFETRVPRVSWFSRPGRVRPMSVESVASRTPGFGHSTSSASAQRRSACLGLSRKAHYSPDRGVKSPGLGLRETRATRQKRRLFARVACSRQGGGTGARLPRIPPRSRANLTLSIREGLLTTRDLSRRETADTESRFRPPFE
jgi:hypothetical protein